MPNSIKGKVYNKHANVFSLRYNAHVVLYASRQIAKTLKGQTNVLKQI